ncbi:hypothetical protein [Aridibaculum aurantiacum]|uniref:hypothetical protein n=1 Tax=Aridibaculum aurantiacum TaxID=2810307 RepID=UPI001A9609BB|nr:hypothetical protein [Aridibaculum aurantiacum]
MLVPAFTTYNHLKVRLDKLAEELDKAEHDYEIALSRDEEFHVLKDLYQQVRMLQRKRTMLFDLAEQHPKLHS